MQHLAARVERVGVEDRGAVAVIDASAASRWLHQGTQDWGGALRIDGEIERVRQIIVVACLAMLGLEQLLGIELHLVGVDTGGGSDGASDDLALREQALHLGVDQSRSELIEIEDARDENRKPDQVEHDDTPRKAREAVAEGEMLDEPADGTSGAIARKAQNTSNALLESGGVRPLPGPVGLGGHRLVPSLFEAVANAIERLDHVEA